MASSRSNLNVAGGRPRNFRSRANSSRLPVGATSVPQFLTKTVDTSKGFVFQYSGLMRQMGAFRAKRKAMVSREIVRCCAANATAPTKD